MKKLEIKIPNILRFLHQQHNTKALRKAKEDNMVCKQYGFNFKILLTHIERITPKNRNNSNVTNISNLLKYKYGRNLDESIKNLQSLNIIWSNLRVLNMSANKLH